MSGDVHVRFCESGRGRFPPATHPVVHVATKAQAEALVVAIGDRMAEVGLRLHPTKTRIVYNKDGRRGLDHEHTSFTFLGFTFQARKAKGKNGVIFTGFLPAISKDALKKVSGDLRQMRIHLKTGLSLTALAKQVVNPVVRGWMQYYGAFYRSALHPLLRRVNAYLMRWLRRKFKRLRSFRKALEAWQRITCQLRVLFAHWAWTTASWGSR